MTNRVTVSEASRFLGQSAMGADANQIDRVQTIGYAAWIDEQMSIPIGDSRCDWLVANGYDQPGTNNLFKNGFGGFDAVVWRKMIASPDTLRQRVTFALSEILVVSLAGLAGGWRQFAGARYLDILEANAFGNYRTLLYEVSTSPAMGEYLTFRGNVKYSATTGALPDENYAREIMQLFTIGLQQLNLDGTPVLSGGKTVETYGQDDVSGLARIFTGWEWDLSVTGTNTPDYQRRPMVQIASRHETGASTFLGSTVPAGLDGNTALNAALDILFAHPNVGPFVSRQLIQRLVTSNPSPAYVERVAAVFNNDGRGTRGNLAAVVKAILLDDEARTIPAATSTSAGKLREPILRLTNWARGFGVTSLSDAWAIGDTSDASTRLGQSPLRSPTVFNFFRPGYTPAGTAIATAGLVAPEFQITNESSVVGYLNFMQTLVATGIGDVKADYTSLQALATSSEALVTQVGLLLTAGQLSSTTLTTIATAINAMSSTTVAALTSRIQAAVLLVMAAPEYLVQK